MENKVVVTTVFYGGEYNYVMFMGSWTNRVVKPKDWIEWVGDPWNVTET